MPSLNPFRWWRCYLRRFDLLILWPACKAEAPDLFHAQAAFLTHMMMDPAWRRDYTEVELVRIVDGLK